MPKKKETAMTKIDTQPMVLNASKTTWFEADKLTLAEIKMSYVFGAKEFIYFRKGEDWLKELVDWYIALGGGSDQILGLAAAYGGMAFEFARDNIESITDLNFKECLEWYLIQAGTREILKKDFSIVKKLTWDKFTTWKEGRQKGCVAKFKILCKDAPENRMHLERWEANRTKVKFYHRNELAGSHRFYLNEKGYAVFWRQGSSKNPKFYGFEGTSPEVTAELKRIFEAEWRESVKP